MHSSASCPNALAEVWASHDYPQHVDHFEFRINEGNPVHGGWGEDNSEKWQLMADLLKEASSGFSLENGEMPNSHV
ncbi:MAG: hypothetical protein GY821_07460 [Gammaproteobacteria bacterium]|nr:hypothetical protein [Gammaproteobacteria bacterium]